MSTTDSPAGTSAGPPSLRDLARDDRGAVMVIALFMTLFLVGALWTIVGIGDALVYRDKTQELADHLAFTAGVVEARGMNFIAATNVLMLVVVAVFMALTIMSMVLTAVKIGTIAAVADHAYRPIALRYLTPSIQASTTANRAVERYKNRVETWLKGMSEAQTATAAMGPHAGTAASLDIATEYGENGLAMSLANGMNRSTAPVDRPLGLPVKNEPMKQLCVYAGDEVRIWVAAQLSDLPKGLSATRVIPEVKVALAILAPILAKPDLVCEGGVWEMNGPKIPSGEQSAAKGASDWNQVYGLVFGTQRDEATKYVGMAKGPKLGLDTPNHDEERVYQAQAEVFFDCDTVWSSPTCNRPSGATNVLPNAMYNMRWMTRLRRVHQAEMGATNSGSLVSAGLEQPLGPLQGKPSTTTATAYAGITSTLGTLGKSSGGSLSGVAEKILGTNTGTSSGGGASSSGAIIH